MTTLNRLCVCLVGLLAAGPVYGQNPDPQKAAQNRLLSRRAAEADAFRKLGELIQGLQITSETYVRDFVAESDTIRTEFDGFVRGVRLGEPKWDSELVCAVEADVTVAKVVEELKSIHSRHYKGRTLKAEDFNQITRHVRKQVLKVVGMGAPRPDLPPDVPGGEIAMPPGVTSAPQPAVPAIWRAIPAKERLMAVKAAERDAQRRLVERIKGLRINSETRVRDFVAESDRIDTEASATLTGAYAVGRPYYHDDELIVEVTYEVPVESVITTVKSLHKRHYKGDKVTGMDIETVCNEIRKSRFQATGMGVPRPAAVQKAAATMKDPTPDWVTTTMRAEGKGVPTAGMSPAQARLMAARAAELDAKRRLAEQIMGFQIDASTSVRDFVAQHDDIHTQLVATVQGAYVTSTAYDDEGTATVTVEMPAVQAWEIIHTYIRVRRM